MIKIMLYKKGTEYIQQPDIRDLVIYDSAMGDNNIYGLSYSASLNNPAEFSFFVTKDSPYYDTLRPGITHYGNPHYQNKDTSLWYVRCVVYEGDDVIDKFFGIIYNVETDVDGIHRVVCRDLLELLKGISMTAQSFNKEGRVIGLSTAMQPIFDAIYGYNQAEQGRFDANVTFSYRGSFNRTTTDEILYGNGTVYDNLVNVVESFGAYILPSEILFNDWYSGLIVIEQSNNTDWDIEYGKNLIDIDVNHNYEGIYSGVLMLGAVIPENKRTQVQRLGRTDLKMAEPRYMISATNPVVYDSIMREYIGTKVAIVIDDNETTVSKLTEKAHEFLLSQDELFSTNFSANVTAFYANELVPYDLWFRVGDNVVIKAPHIMDMFPPLKITAINYDFGDPEGQQLTLGKLTESGLKKEMNVANSALSSQINVCTNRTDVERVVKDMEMPTKEYVDAAVAGATNSINFSIDSGKTSTIKKSTTGSGHYILATYGATSAYMSLHQVRLNASNGSGVHKTISSSSNVTITDTSSGITVKNGTNGSMTVHMYGTINGVAGVTHT